MININNYLTYTYWIDEEQKNQINEDNNIYVQSLELEFSSYDIEDLNSLYNKYNLYIVLISIINYILFFWMYSMIFTSFYKRELLNDNK